MKKLDVSALKNPSQGSPDVADPVLNEKLILAELDHISSAVNAPSLKNGAKLAIIDAFDRRPNRDPFGDLVTEACSLQANLSRLEFAVHLRTIMKQGKLTDEMLGETIKSLTQCCEERREGVKKKFHPVTEMRHSTDALN